MKAVRDAAAAAIDVRALIEALRADPALARELGSVLLAAVATAATPTEWSSRKGCAPPGYSDRRWRAIAKQIGTLRGRWYVVSASALARYEAGMKYGAHADTAHLMVDGAILQSDISATVFIADPSTYQGGELVMHVGTRPVVAKGAPGEVIVYPSTMLHEVRPVRSGTRLVSITFIESLVPNEYQRTQLYELNEVAALEGMNMHWQNRVRLETVRQNLLRMWSRSS